MYVFAMVYILPLLKSVAEKLPTDIKKILLKGILPNQRILEIFLLEYLLTFSGLIAFSFHFLVLRENP